MEIKAPGLLLQQTEKRVASPPAAHPTTAAPVDYTNDVGVAARALAASAKEHCRNLGS